MKEDAHFIMLVQPCSDEKCGHLDCDVFRQTESKTNKERRRQTIGKRTSEGYKPKDKEKVELRGD